MERLTERDEFGNADIIGVESADLQFNLTYDDFNRVTDALNKLSDYEDAEEQGLLLRLPCKVGDTLWSFIGHKVVEVEVLSVKYECEAENYGVFIRERIIVSGKDIVATEIDFSDIGKTVFINKEEAEQALKQMGE